MSDVGKDVGVKANANISQFLNDFATRHIKDEQVEVLGFDDVLFENPINEMFDFPETAEQEEMLPLNAEKQQDDSPVEIVDVAALIAEAVAKTKTELEQKFAAEKQQIQQQHQAELQAQKDKTVAEIAANVETEFSKIFDDVYSKINTDIAQFLAIMVADKMRQTTLEDFAKQITKAALAARKPWIVEGNAVLLDALVKIPTFNALQFELRPVDSAEIRFRLNDKVIATRLEPLLAELKELVR